MRASTFDHLAHISFRDFMDICKKCTAKPGEKIYLPDQNGVIEQDKFTYSPVGNVLDKQTKTIDTRQLSIKDFIFENKLIPWIVNKFKKIEKLEEKLTGIKCSTKDTEKYMILKKIK